MELFNVHCRELKSLVDHSWRMDMGGVLKEEGLPV